MKNYELSESQKEKIIAAVINSDEANELIHKFATTIAPAIGALFQIVQQAIKEELSKATEENDHG